MDEASNMDNKMASMFLNCFPKAQLVVFVFDDGQIGPISPGQLAFDLLKFFKDNNFPLGQLTENMRVNRDPRAQQILLNDQLLMSGKVKEMKFNPLPDSNEHLPPGTFMAEYKDQEDLKQKIHQLYTQQIPNVDLLKVITLTNRERTTVNDCVDELMKMRLQDEDDEDNKVPVTAKYYHGQRLMVYNQNYHEKKVSDRPHAVSNAINNGEEFTFGKCRSLILSPNRAWTGEGKGYAEMQHLLPMTKNADKYRIFFIDDKGEKRYCIGDGFIQVDNIQPAWAITSNKSQGREYEYVIVVLPRTIGQMPRCFIRNHLHVMVSRPKTILVVLGSREVLETLAQRQANDRFTLLANLFSLRLTRYFKTTKTITFRLNEKIQDYKQHQLDNKAHFESLDKPKSSKKSASAPKRKPKQETEDSSSSDDDVNFMSPTKIAHKMMRQLEGQKGGRKKKEESSSDEESKEDSSDDEIMDEAEEKGSDESESDPDASEEGSIDESDAGDLDAADAHDAENIQRSHDDDSENSDDPDFIVIDNDEQVFLPKKLRKRRLYKSSSDEDAMQVELYDEPMIPGLEFTNQDFDKEDSSHNHSEESLKQDEESSSSSSSTKRQREESSSDDDTPPHKKPRPDD